MVWLIVATSKYQVSYLYTTRKHKWQIWVILEHFRILWTIFFFPVLLRQRLIDVQRLVSDCVPAHPVLFWILPRVCKSIHRNTLRGRYMILMSLPQINQCRLRMYSSSGPLLLYFRLIVIKCAVAMTVITLELNTLWCNLIVMGCCYRNRCQ